MNCPKCGRVCQMEDFFCARCGAKLQHDNVTFETEETKGKDLRPLSANPVRPDRPAGSPFVERAEKPVRSQRKPLFEGYEPVPEEKLAETPALDQMEPVLSETDGEPTAVYRRAVHAQSAENRQDMDMTRIVREGKPAFAAVKLPEKDKPAPVPEKDEFGWDEDQTQASAKKRRFPLFARKNAEETPEDETAEEETLDQIPEESFEEENFEEENFEEEPEEEDVFEEPVRRVSLPRRKPLPDLKKPVSHIRPVSQDRPREDPVFLFDDELEEEEERGRSTRLHLKILALLTLAALVVFGVCFFKVTDTGRRIQAMVGISSESEDYILLGNYHMQRGSYSEAANAYYSAFLLDQEDYDLALRVAEGLKQSTDYDRAVKLYMYLIDKVPGRREAVDRLLNLYQQLGWTENYERLLEKTGGSEQQTAPAPQESAPAENAPQTQEHEQQAVQGSFQAPSVSVEGGSYAWTVQLTMSTVSGAEIYYTLDGSQPTEQSTLYTGIILLDESREYQLRAVAVLDGACSYELSETYRIQLD